MRKRCKRVIRDATAPVMVAMALSPEVEITERMALLWLERGTDEVAHFDRLLDVADALLLAANEKRDQPVVEVAHQAREALSSIRDDYRTTGILHATGSDLAALQIIVDLSTDWWARQSGALFVQADLALSRFRAMQREAHERV